MPLKYTVYIYHYEGVPCLKKTFENYWPYRLHSVATGFQVHTKGNFDTVDRGSHPQSCMSLVLATKTLW